MNQESFIQAKNFIYKDIGREIALAKISAKSDAGDADSTNLVKELSENGVEHGGGNFMAGLALLCYIEFAGKLKFNNKKKNREDNSSKNFNDFFDTLGAKYKELRQGHNVYNLIRCGFAHEYYVKGNSAVAMFTDNDTGLWYDNKNKRYVLVVEKFFEDFKNAFDELEKELFPDSD